MLDHDAAAFLELKVAPLPRDFAEPIRKRFVADYAHALTIPAGTGRQSEALRDANIRLTRITKRAADAWIDPTAADADIREIAAAEAKATWALAARSHDAGTLRARMAQRCLARGITPPAENIADMPAIRRMTDEGWWRRKVRRTQAALVEEIAIELGLVHRHRQCYCSDETVKRRRAQTRRNALTLESIELENQHGFVATVADLAATSVSNPKIKHAELMTRMSGFESLARSLDYAAVFITITCPSRFHAVLENGRPNPKHDGSTPREAQHHLVTAWAKCRAALHRRHIRPFGFRVAEPHHDGCPHWHLLLFVPPDQESTLRDIIARYFLEQHDPDEAGARKNRVKFVAIDYTRGTAAGYIAKYVSKAIDGEHIEDGDHYGNSGRSAAERVKAWAAAHGLRQFQQIGGAPVTPWRELRRIEPSDGHPEVIKAARSAADAGNWARYLEVQGGRLSRAKTLPSRSHAPPKASGSIPTRARPHPQPTSTASRPPPRFSVCATPQPARRSCPADSAGPPAARASVTACAKPARTRAARPGAPRQGRRPRSRRSRRSLDSCQQLYARRRRHPCRGQANRPLRMPRKRAGVAHPQHHPPHRHPQEPEMDPHNATLPELQRELSDLEGRVAEVRAAIALRTNTRPGTTATTMRDSRLTIANLSNAAGSIKPDAASTLLTDC